MLHKNILIIISSIFIVSCKSVPTQLADIQNNQIEVLQKVEEVSTTNQSIEDDLVSLQTKVPVEYKPEVQTIIDKVKSNQDIIETIEVKQIQVIDKTIDVNSNVQKNVKNVILLRLAVGLILIIIVLAVLHKLSIF